MKKKHYQEKKKKNPIQDREKERKRIHELGQIYFEQEGGRFTFEKKMKFFPLLNMSFWPMVPSLRC
jgi:pilus assembly protein CpaF